MFQQVEVNSPTLTEIGRRHLEISELFFVSFRTNASLGDFPRFDRGQVAVLTDLLESDALRECLPRLFPLNMVAAMKYSALDYYELEGSLLSMLIRGACVEKVVCDEEDARAKVRTILQEAPFCSDRNLRAFRMDDCEWSALTDAATLWSAFFVYFPSARTWTVIGFADNY